jgi:hypothetical protein
MESGNIYKHKKYDNFSGYACRQGSFAKELKKHRKHCNVCHSSALLSVSLSMSLSLRLEQFR